MSESISGMAWVSASSFPLAMVFYAMTFGQALADLLRWAERAREAQA